MVDVSEARPGAVRHFDAKTLGEPPVAVTDVGDGAAPVADAYGFDVQVVC